MFEQTGNKPSSLFPRVRRISSVERSHLKGHAFQ